MPPPESDLTIREVWRGLQRIEAMQGDIVRRMDRLHDDFVSRRQFDEHKRDTDRRLSKAATASSVSRIEADLKDIEQRITPSKAPWTAVAAVVTAIVAVSLSTLIQLVALFGGLG